MLKDIQQLFNYCGKIKASKEELLNISSDLLQRKQLAEELICLAQKVEFLDTELVMKKAELECMAIECTKLESRIKLKSKTLRDAEEAYKVGLECKKVLDPLRNID